jgi:predicted RND superfamily exporter protein
LHRHDVRVTAQLDLERGVSPSRRFVEWAVRHGKLLWLVALLLALPAAIRTGWLYAHLRSELEELLPRNSPSVVALTELKERLGGRQYLGIVVDAGSARDLPGAERFLDDLADRARAYPPGTLAQVRTGDDVERAFLEQRGALYLDLDDLHTVRARLEARRDHDVARQTGTLLDDGEAAPPPVDVHDLRARYQARLHGKGARATSRYTSEREHLSVLLLELGQYSSGADAATRLMDRVKRDVSELRATGGYPASMRVGYAGDAAIAAEELSALVTDLSVSSIVVVIVVMAVIMAYYRWWRSILVVVPPLLVATVYAFGIASLPPFRVTTVNSNTAFLGSIIVGNGINFGLLLLSRYVDERRAGADVHLALERAVAGSRAGTLAAASAAAVSYAALAITQFQGFRQFGFIGGLGMMFAWGAAFLLMPSLISWLDTGDRTRPANVSDRARVSFWLTRAIARAPRLVVVAATLATAVAAAQVAKFRPDDLESDFSKLRRADTWTKGEGYWGDRMNAVLGEYLTPLVLLADRPEEARALAAAVREHRGDAALAGRVDSVRTLEDVLPTDQRAKLDEIALLQEDLTPSVWAGLSPSERQDLGRLVEGARPLALDDLPRAFTLGLRERDGTTGRVVLVYPNPSAGWWDAGQMAGFVGSLRQLASQVAPDHPPRLAGSIPLSSDIVQAIRHDGPIASAAAFLGVAVTVVLLLRASASAGLVLAALVVGVVWLAGASHLLGIRINFANFIAFPITFGIGVDYAVNVVSRYERDGARDILAAVRSTGAAVALCSLTTIVGYSSLLMAKNRALFLFGLLAVLGEVACLTVALVALPAAMLTFGASGRRHLAHTTRQLPLETPPVSQGTR